MLNDYKPHIGKNVIETLTSGMYREPRFIFREYVQNAADQIDIAVEMGILDSREEGRITLTIDAKSNIISIEDNATGIESKRFLRFLGDVAHSDKDPAERKGFRGIGRLGGLGYCNNLVFETSYRGEKTKSIMKLDAKLLARIIENRSEDADAARVISMITTVTTEVEKADLHYFRVMLQDVTDRTILDESYVRSYLEMVAPLPFFKNFKFNAAIHNHFKSNGFSLDEYRVFLGTKQLFKTYRNTVVDGSHTTIIIAIDFLKVSSKAGKILALGWYGMRDFVNEALTDKVNERGIRLRKANIQIGDEDTLNRFFKAERTNFRFIGELHAINPLLIPNGRRDYFVPNVTCQEFDEELKDLFKQKDLENKLAQKVSKVHSRTKDIEKYKELMQEYNQLKMKIDSPAKDARYRERISISYDKALKGVKEIEKVRKDAESDYRLKVLYEYIIADKDLSFDPNIESILKARIYDPPIFSKLSNAESIIVREIIELIFESGISMDDAEMLKSKIVKKYN